MSQQKTVGGSVLQAPKGRKAEESEPAASGRRTEAQGLHTPPTKIVIFDCPCSTPRRVALVKNSLPLFHDTNTTSHPLPPVSFSLRSRAGKEKKKRSANMSRFFRGADDSSSESSSDEDERYDSDAEQEQTLGGRTGGQADSDDDDSDDMSGQDSDDDSSDDSDAPRGAARFLTNASDSESDSDDEVRAKVKSAKDKRLDELESSIKQIENGQKNGDWTLISAGTSRF